MKIDRSMCHYTWKMHDNIDQVGHIITTRCWNQASPLTSCATYVQNVDGEKIFYPEFFLLFFLNKFKFKVCVCARACVFGPTAECACLIFQPAIYTASTNIWHGSWMECGAHVPHLCGWCNLAKLVTREIQQRGVYLALVEPSTIRDCYFELQILGQLTYDCSRPCQGYNWILVPAAAQRHKSD